MKLGHASVWAALAAALLALPGCSWAPGRPKPGPEIPRPQAVLDFPTLYRQNCSACHGDAGVDGPAYPLANPEYQALVDDKTLRQTVAQGVPGTMMPAFATEAGGTLTDAQIDALVSGMRSRWLKPAVFSGAFPPPYRASGAANSANGLEVYTQYCARCHGSAQQPGGKAGSILDSNFLALVSDQALRTVVIAGRPDLGQPDWRGDQPGQPLTGQQVSDLVAWLSSHRYQPSDGGESDGAAQAANKSAAKMQKRSGGGFK